MTDLAKNFGKKLKQIRKAQQLTQSQLAEKLKVETLSISRIESGKHFPKKENIELLARVLNVEIKDLFDFGAFKTKSELIKEINQILKTASIKDIQFFKTVLSSYIELK